MPTRARDWDRPVHKMMSDELTMDDLLQNGIKEGRDESAGGTAQGLTKTRKVGSASVRNKGNTNLNLADGLGEDNKNPAIETPGYNE